MAATIKFDQSGKPAGVNNRSRSDIDAGTATTITNVSPGSVNVCELLAKPTDDNTAAITGSSPTWSITPKSGTFGTYRIRLTVDGVSVIHTFTVKSPILGLEIGAHNERANLDANLEDTDPGTWVNESETNEGGHFKGWQPGDESNFKIIDDNAQVIKRTFTKATHGFTVREALYKNSSGVWTKAKADDSETLGLFVVSEVVDANNFTAVASGFFTDAAHGLTANRYYFVSDSTAGLLTLTAPTTVGRYTNPIVFVVDADTLLVLPFRPAEVPPSIYRPFYMDGLNISNGTDADHDIDIAAGYCIDTAGTYDLGDAGAITIVIDDSGAINKLDTGTVGNNSYYHIWKLEKSADESKGYVFSLSNTLAGVTKPAGYDKGQWIGVVRTDGSANIRAFIQTGDGRIRTYHWNFWDTGVLRLESTGAGTAGQWYDCSNHNAGEDLFPPRSITMLVQIEAKRTAADINFLFRVRPKGSSFHDNFRAMHGLDGAGNDGSGNAIFELPVVSDRKVEFTRGTTNGTGIVDALGFVTRV